MGLWWNTTTNIQSPTDGDWKGGAGGRAELYGLLLRLMEGAVHLLLIPCRVTLFPRNSPQNSTTYMYIVCYSHTSPAINWVHYITQQLY